jgi:hypothetical protein
MKAIFIILLLNITILCTYAQKGLMLTSRYSGKQKFLPEGTKILYGYTSISSLANQPVPANSIQARANITNGYLTYRPIMGRGAFHIMNDSTIQVDKEIIPLKNLYLISKRGRFNLRPILLMVGGTALMVGSINTHVDADQRINPVLMGLGVGLFGVAIADAVGSVPKTTSVWRVEVVR